MNLTRLRNLLHPFIVNPELGTHALLPSICEDFALPAPPPDGSKRDRMSASFANLADANLAKTAERVLAMCHPTAQTRQEIEDILWTGLTPEIPKRYRREVARALDKGPDTLFSNGKGFDELLNRLWIQDFNPLADFGWGKPQGLKAEILRHVHRNPSDWSVELLFENLGAYDASDTRFARFLEGLASSDVNPDIDRQNDFVEIVNQTLRGCGLELRQCGTEGGYPAFAVVSTHAAAIGRPKNLIFASSYKPDLRFRDAISNEIEIVTNADQVLIYDREFPPHGLLWRDLQSWWAELEKIADPIRAKETLYRRLRASLPSSSPPQRLFFTLYHEIFSPYVLSLPVLLPEVWLHWDAKTVRERGRDALFRFRMDFLMLLPGDVRVVIEIDGKHHFADKQGVADIERYAKMVAADRELKLAGYHVFRFGAAELLEDSPGTRAMVKDFFEALFKRYNVQLPSSG